MKCLKASDTILSPSSSKVSSSLAVLMHDNKGITNIFKIEPLKILQYQSAELWSNIYRENSTWVHLRVMNTRKKY